MIKKYGIWLFAAFFTLQSCSVNTETTYYKDSGTSMESSILMDQSMMGMLKSMGDNSDMLQNNKDLGKLTTEWKSLYDIQKDEKVTLNKDSVQLLKKMFLKLNKDKGELYGISMKYDKLMPKEVESLLSQSKQLKDLPLQEVATWNGNILTIDTEKFSNTDFLKGIAAEKEDPKKTEPASKSDSVEVFGKDMANGMLGMLKMFDINFSSTLKFQKPIKSIVGKHDFVTQVDNKTVKINLKSKDLLDPERKFTNQDKKIIITTE